MTAPPVDAQSVVDAVRAAVIAAGVPFGDAKAPTREGTKPWVVAWSDGGIRRPRSLAGDAGRAVTLTCHCYGTSTASARGAADRLGTAIESLRGAVLGGQAVLFTTQTTALPVSRDDTVTPPIFDAIVEWRLTTTPTS